MNNSILISLGWNCHVALFIQEFGRAERQVFDWLGSPMWSINRLIENNFDKLLEKDLIIPRKRYVDKKDMIYSHTLYDIRFLHDFGKNQEFSTFQEKYMRRIERFQSLLVSGKELMFFRLEQNHYNRIQYEEFKNEMGDEKIQVEKFADLMKEKNVKYTIIYFTITSPRFFDKERNIIYVQFGKKSPTLEIGVDEIKQIYLANQAFIKSCLGR